MSDIQAIGEYKERVRRVVRNSAILILVFTLGIITPYQAIFIGLTLGGTISLFNFIYTAWKVHKIGNIALMGKGQKRKKPVFIGMAWRMSTAILAAMVALKNPETVNLFSTIAGLMVVQTLAVVDGIKHT